MIVATPVPGGGWVPRAVEGLDGPLTPLLLPDGPVAFPLSGPQASPVVPDLVTHRAALGPRPRGGAQLVDDVDAAGLTGRGGGHFPAARKWRAVREGVRRSHRTPVVVANAAEGEPASAKDRALLTTRPHLVLDGLVCAAEAVGAEHLVLWAHGDDDVLHGVLAQALRERLPLDEPAIRLVTAPAAYLSGEASSVVRGLSGGPALPRFSLEHATTAGVDGRPTLVHNVETLARVGLLARTGPGAAPRTTLATVVTDDRRTVVEVHEDAALAAALTTGAWPAGRPAQAVLVGGYGGRWLAWDVAAQLALNPAAMRAAGAPLGAGVLAPLPADRCGLAETARVVRYLADSGARQCGPCLFGLPALAERFEALAGGGTSRRRLDQLERWAAEISGRGGCHHPDGAVSLVRSALATFAVDVRAHLRGRPCPGTAAGPLLPVPARRSS
jgi:NADH:ubiquinone oxidoreductase subunit F (NADH-binding)